MNKHTKKTGFTLIELLVVIAIVGVLSGVVIQSLNSSRAKSRNATRMTQIDQVNKALELWATTSGVNRLPRSGAAGAATYVCLGRTGANSTSQDCTGAGTADTNAVSTNLAMNMGGYVSGSTANVPKDPYFNTGIGHRYLYHSAINPSGTPANQCTGGATPTCPAGAYLMWIAEQSTNCGRGKYWQSNINGTGNNLCVLRVGEAVN